MTASSPIVRRETVVSVPVEHAFSAYGPPRRLVFSWDIGPTWQLETDTANTSEVEVRFEAEALDRTRVTLEHRYLDRQQSHVRTPGPSTGPTLTASDKTVCGVLRR